MTNKAYFISQLGFGPSSDVVEAALTDAGMVADDIYQSANSITLKKSAIQTLQILLSTPDTTQGTGETANAIKYDRDAILKRIDILQNDIGVVKSSLKARHIW